VPREIRRGEQFCERRLFNKAGITCCVLQMGIGSFPGVRCVRGVLPTTHPLLVSRRVGLYLYPPSGPHRACNGKTLPILPS